MKSRNRFTVMVASAALAAGAACGSPEQPTPQINAAAGGSEQQTVATPAPGTGPFSAANTCTDRRRRDQYTTKTAGTLGGQPLFLHEIAQTNAQEARAHARDLHLPTHVPDWLECVSVDVLWESPSDNPNVESTSYGVTVYGYDGRAADSASNAILFKALAPVPADGVKGSPGSWEPIEGREGYWRDVSAEQDDGAGPTTGVRIAWVREPRYYFELVGPFTLEEALRIADSVSPAG